MRTATLTVAALVAALLTLPETGEAQNLVQVYELTPKDGQQAAFEAALQRHGEWREANGDPWKWDVYQVVQGENHGAFMVRSWGHSWSDLDAYSEGFGREAVDHYNATVAPLVKETKSYVSKVDTARSYFHPGNWSLAEMFTYKLKPGKSEEWLEAVQAIRDAYEQENRSQYFETFNRPVGAGVSHARIAVLHENYADFRDEDWSPLEVVQAVYGEEKAEELSDQYYDSYSALYNMVLRPRPDLSVQAAGEGGGQ